MKRITIISSLLAALFLSFSCGGNPSPDGEAGRRLAQTIPVPSVISAEKIYVGRDVNDREEQGNVILGQGDITLRSKTVIIKNSTTVPLGTKLKIVNQ